MTRKQYCDDEEKQLIESVENGQWQPVGDLHKQIEEAREIALNTTTKKERMNIRMNEQDIRSLKAKAIEQGMPYQTLVSSILHKYVKGQLVEKG